VLYFASADGQALIAESRDIQACPDETSCLLDTVKALLAGPQDADLAAVFPQQVAVNNVQVEDSLVKVDFSRELVSAHPGGTQSEMLTVYALVDTLSVNFPHLRQVEIHVDGVPLETLKGHVDLRRPVVPDFSLVEEGAVPIGLTGDQSAERSE
jgi:spore germination protein GerM